MSENEFLCPDCGKPMTLAPGVDYYCQTPACVKKMREEFWASFRKDHQAELSERATIEDLSRKLEEARGRIAELERKLDRNGSDLPWGPNCLSCGALLNENGGKSDA